MGVACAPLGAHTHRVRDPNWIPNFREARSAAKSAVANSTAASRQPNCILQGTWFGSSGGSDEFALGEISMRDFETGAVRVTDSVLGKLRPLVATQDVVGVTTKT